MERTNMTFLEETAADLRPVIERAGYLVTLDAMAHIAREQAVEVHDKGRLADERYLRAIAAKVTEVADYFVSDEHVV
jgi:hypothetical protein